MQNWKEPWDARPDSSRVGLAHYRHSVAWSNPEYVASSSGARFQIDSHSTDNCAGITIDDFQPRQDRRRLLAAHYVSQMEITGSDLGQGFSPTLSAVGPGILFFDRGILARGSIRPIAQCVRPFSFRQNGRNVSPGYSKPKNEHIRGALISRYPGNERIPDVLVTRD